MLPNTVSKFIRKSLVRSLEQDFCEKPFRIFRERDLHACCYFHLRLFLKKDRDWEIINEPFLYNLKGKGKSAQPDIVLLRNGKLQYLIELKFRKNKLGAKKKDKKVLRNAVKKKKWAKKCFYIEVVIEPRQKNNTKLYPYRSKSISILMDKSQLEEYKKKYGDLRQPSHRLKLGRSLKS